jgi:hypothetical protein
VGVLTHRGTLGAVGAEVERAVQPGSWPTQTPFTVSANTVQPTEQCVHTDFLISSTRVSSKNPQPMPLEAVNQKRASL